MTEMLSVAGQKQPLRRLTTGRAVVIGTGKLVTWEGKGVGGPSAPLQLERDSPQLITTINSNPATQPKAIIAAHTAGFIQVVS